MYQKFNSGSKLNASNRQDEAYTESTDYLNSANGAGRRPAPPQFGGSWAAAPSGYPLYGAPETAAAPPKPGAPQCYPSKGYYDHTGARGFAAAEGNYPSGSAVSDGAKRCGAAAPPERNYFAACTPEEYLRYAPEAPMPPGALKNAPAPGNYAAAAPYLPERFKRPAYPPPGVRFAGRPPNEYLGFPVHAGADPARYAEFERREPTDAGAAPPPLHFAPYYGRGFGGPKHGALFGAARAPTAPLHYAAFKSLPGSFDSACEPPGAQFGYACPREPFAPGFAPRCAAPASEPLEARAPAASAPPPAPEAKQPRLVRVTSAKSFYDMVLSREE